MTRVAAFDCGTNSLRLLVAEIDLEAGRSTDLVREMRIVRLGQGVDRTGRIAESSLKRVFTALDELMVTVRDQDVEAIRFCATSAARDAENAEELVSGVRARTGVEPEVLDGDAEAEASFAGAVRELPPLPEPILVLDIGGGSTELILGRQDGTIETQQSLDLGSVRLNERHLAGDPPTQEEIAARGRRHRRGAGRLLGRPGGRRGRHRRRRHGHHDRGRGARPARLRRLADPPLRAASRRRAGRGRPACWR